MTKQIAFLKSALLMAAVALPMVAQAHPGHDMLDHGTSHALTNAYHLSILAVGGIAAVALAQALRQPRLQRAFRFAGAVMLTAAVGISLL